MIEKQKEDHRVAELLHSFGAGIVVMDVSETSCLLILFNRGQGPALLEDPHTYTLGHI